MTTPEKAKPRFRSKFCGNCRQYRSCRTKPKSQSFKAMREKALRYSWYVRLVCYGHHDHEEFDAPMDSQTCLHCPSIIRCIERTIEVEV